MAGGTAAAALPLLYLGPVGSGGLAAIGIGVAVAAYAGGKAGEVAGGLAAEEILKSGIPDGQAEFVDTVVDFSNNPVPLD